MIWGGLKVTCKTAIFSFKSFCRKCTNSIGCRNCSSTGCWDFITKSFEGLYCWIVGPIDQYNAKSSKVASFFSSSAHAQFKSTTPIFSCHGIEKISSFPTKHDLWKKLALWDVCVWTTVQARTITLTVPTLFIQTTSCYMTGDEYAKMLSIYHSMLINKKPYISTFNVNEVKICIDQRRLRIGKMFSLLLEHSNASNFLSPFSDHRSRNNYFQMTN